MKIVLVQETHWRGSWQLSKARWHVVSSGTHEEQGAGVMIMVHDSLCRARDIRFNEILPERLMHLRVPGASFPIDVLPITSLSGALSRLLRNIRSNVEQHWTACPRQLALFREHLDSSRGLQHVSPDGQEVRRALHHRSQQAGAEGHEGLALLSLSPVCRCQLQGWQSPLPSSR